MNKQFIFMLVAALGFAMPVASQAATCGDCGKIKQIETVSGHRSSTGGLVAGALVGGVVGHQVGGGDGKKLATVAGALGGAYAGKKIAENSEKTQYRILVKMDDGHYETVTQNSAKDLKIGQSVRIKNGKVTRL